MVVGKIRKMGLILLAFFIATIGISMLVFAKPVSLDDAVAAALESTEVVPLGKTRVQQAEARVDQSKGAFWPSLSFGASYQQQDTGGILTRQSSSLFGGRQSFSRLTLSQSLFEGGRDMAMIGARQAEKDRWRHELEQNKQTVYSSVARAFFLVQGSQAEVENLKTAIRLARDRVKEVASREKIGRSRDTELLSARAQVSVLEAQLMAAEGQLIASLDEFSLMTGLARETELETSEEIPSMPEALESYLKRVEERPDILALKSELQMLEEQKRVVRAGHFPSLSLLGNYYFSREGTQKGNDWDVGVSMNFPLFMGGSVTAQNREVVEKEQELQLLIARQRRRAQIAIRTTYNNLISALNQHKALKEALLSTERSYQLNAKNYRFGQSTNLEVIQAMNSYQETKRAIDRSRFQALLAWAELRVATSFVFPIEKEGSL